MQLKATYLIFLTIGINLLQISCGKTRVDYVVKGEFDYLNSTPNKVKLSIIGGFKSAVSTYVIFPKDTLRLYMNDQTHEKVVNPQFYKPAISGDTTIMIFLDTLCYAEYNFVGNILQNINSYSYTKNGDRDYTFFYNIDTTLLKLSTRCK